VEVAMSIIVIDVKDEKHPDGVHVFSPQVPAFHIIEQTKAKALRQGLPILKETVQQRRAEEAGQSVTFRPTMPIDAVIPREIRELASRRPARMPRQFVVEFSPLAGVG
jgi:hypothetical protein